MERRTFLALIPASLLTAPLAAEAQMGKGWRIGYLVPGPAACPVTKSIRAFRQGLLDAGLVEGRDITIDRRCYPTDAVARKILDELLHARPSVLVAGGLAALAMKDVRGIPIVFGSVPDPVGDGLVHSLARPGTNMTGLTDLSPELDAKRMEILKEALPSVRLAATLGVSDQPRTDRFRAETDRAAAKVGLQLRHYTVRRADELPGAFEAMKKEGVQGIVIQQNPLLWTERTRIGNLGLTYRLPIIYSLSGTAEEGSLLAYGADGADLWRRVAGYVAKILKGAKPADLPVEQPTKFELVINLKTAKALGLTIPPSLLARADQVIE
jgi:putative tryptophan/tyrosine transport system substrate-binding protein